ncbi:MAG: hypothetical protein MUE92_10165 [Chloroflexi bacterium]|nr:hypothetical protein [Chloroflexota bacterium]
MTRPDEPSQASVLRERFSRVPWRRAIREAIRDRAGKGPTALPDRLEGAVFGCLVGDAHDGLPQPAGDPRGDVPSAPPRAGGRLLVSVDALLRGDQPGPTGFRSFAVPADGSPASGDALVAALALPLVMRTTAAPDLASLAARVSREAGEAEAQVACAMVALVGRRLLAGERDRRLALTRAAREVRAAWAASGSPASGSPASGGASTPAVAAVDAFLAGPGRATGDPAAGSFWSAWSAFADASDYRETVASPGLADAAATAALAGGLAGLYWGSAAIPAASRRRLPDWRIARELVDRLVETDVPGWDGRTWRTSTSSPLRVDAIDLSGILGLAAAASTGRSATGGTAGGLGITFLPGKRYVGYHTGGHWRDLDADADRLHALGVDVVLLLVEDRELARCRVPDIGHVLPTHGVELLRFPIPDPLVPRDDAAFHATVASVLRRVRDGQLVAIACRGGLDRSGLAAACLLREAGLPADEAIERVQRARRGALTLPDQQAYVRRWPSPEEPP